VAARVVVTGAQGGLGRHVVAELGAHGYDVVPVDVAPGGPPELTFDLRDYDRVREALAGADLVAHLAANPEPDRDELTGPQRFEENTVSTFNVFWAACHAGVPRVAWASSETVYGYPYEEVAPDSFPVREDARLKPQSGYALSKVVGEDLARRLEARFGTTFVALRFSNILHSDPDHPASYAKVPSYQADPMVRVGNLWGYIDARDAAVATRLALEVDLPGSVELTIAAANTIVDTPNAELVARRFPDVPLEVGWGPHRTLLAIDRARDVLGWEPQVSWRDEV
jgi:nucleoside-diphosphate-sugar epimerase